MLGVARCMSKIKLHRIPLIQCRSRSGRTRVAKWNLRLKTKRPAYMTSRKASFASFGSLSQVIHQLDQRFVVITYTNDASSDPLRENLPPVEGVEDPEEGERCTFFEVGEIGGTNRWWRGIWTAEDVQKAVVSGGWCPRLTLL